MKRRGFLGMAAAGTIAAPALARAALEKVALSNQINSIGPMVGGGQISKGLLGGDRDWAKNRLAELVGKSAEQMAREKRRFPVHTLDGDIADSRSLAWHAKIRMQRDRDYERMHQEEILNLEEIIASVLSLD